MPVNYPLGSKENSINFHGLHSKRGSSFRQGLSIQTKKKVTFRIFAPMWKAFGESSSESCCLVRTSEGGGGGAWLSWRFFFLNFLTVFEFKRNPRTGVAKECAVCCPRDVCWKIPYLGGSAHLLTRPVPKFPLRKHPNVLNGWQC